MKLIAGMHRSGTSLVAQLFFSAGADMGDPTHFYRPDQWNPDGYFEHPDIHAINMPLIHGPLWKFSYLMLPSQRTIRRRGRRFATQIRRTCVKYQGKIVKENRFCLTLDAWLEQGTQIDKILFVFRHPQAVARSLQKRNWVSVKKAYALWLMHNNRLLKTAEQNHIPCGFIRYESLLHAAHQLDEAKFGLNFFDIAVQPDELKIILSTVAKNDLNHHPGIEHSRQLPATVDVSWNSLVQRHRQQRRSGRSDPTTSDRDAS